MIKNIIIIIATLLALQNVANALVVLAVNNEINEAVTVLPFYPGGPMVFKAVEPNKELRFEITGGKLQNLNAFPTKFRFQGAMKSGNYYRLKTVKLNELNKLITEDIEFHKKTPYPVSFPSDFEKTNE